MYESKFVGDFKANFSQAVEELLKLDLPVQYRIGQVEILTEAYFEQTGKRPDPFQLERLADFILRDELSNPHADKVTNTEFPILSDGQIKLRIGRECSGDVTRYTPDVKHKMHGSRKSASRDAHFFTGSRNDLNHARRNQLED